MNKEKQTVGRAKELKELEKIVRSVLENRTDIKYIPNLALPIADELFKHYQPKIPKGSVVVDKEYLKKELQGLELQARRETAREIATKIKEKVDEISSCGLVEEYVTVLNKHINDIVEELDYKTEIEAVI